MRLQRSTAYLIVNMLVFQAFWFAAVLGGNRFAIPAAVVALLIHAALMRPPACEWGIIVAVGCLGFCVDTLMMAAGVVEFWQGQVVAPWWLILMWLIFATTLNHSLAWLQGRALLAALLGALGGAAGYIAGVKLGAGVVWTHIAVFAGIYGLIWAIFLPVALYLAAKCKNRSNMDFVKE